MFDLDIRSWMHKYRSYPHGEGTWIFGVAESVNNPSATIYVGHGEFQRAYQCLIDELIRQQVVRAYIVLADWEVFRGSN